MDAKKCVKTQKPGMLAYDYHPALGKLKQENQEFEAGMDYMRVFHKKMNYKMLQGKIMLQHYPSPNCYTFLLL